MEFSSESARYTIEQMNVCFKYLSSFDFAVITTESNQLLSHDDVRKLIGELEKYLSKLSDTNIEVINCLNSTNTTVVKVSKQKDFSQSTVPIKTLKIKQSKKVEESSKSFQAEPLKVEDVVKKGITLYMQ